jgi:hypothetical protein
MIKKESEVISKKLDAIISILMNQTKIQEENSRDKITRLIKLGFENNEIADILGTTYSVVGKERSLLKKRSSNE